MEREKHKQLKKSEKKKKITRVHIDKKLTKKTENVVQDNSTETVVKQKSKKIGIIKKKSKKLEQISKIEPEQKVTKEQSISTTEVIQKPSEIRKRGRPRKKIIEKEETIKIEKPVTEQQVPVPQPVPQPVPEQIQKPVITKPAIEQQPVSVIPKPQKIKINELTTVRELAEKIGKQPTEIIKKLLSLGTTVTINQRIEPDIAELIAHEYGYETEFISFYSDDVLEEYKPDTTKLVPRAPIVTVMGHVDHGKTTLLDTIRKTKVTESEVGGITQHIGAYRVDTQKGSIVFLDTPGHELFTAMRAHGAKITDIVVLVVAADDGVMPQTIEAINHARSAGVPIIVAINKIDMPNSNPEKVKQQLASYNLLPDQWGGDTLTVEISARNNINIDKLLDTILFKAELMELKSNPDCPARGIVVEAKLDSRKGPLGTILIQDGTLKIGNNFICGLTYGKVKSIINNMNQRINSAGPSTPVEVLGFDSVPFVGDKFIVVKDEYTARDIVEKRRNIYKQQKYQTRHRISLEDIKSSGIKQLNLIIKADVIGSLCAIRDAIDRIDLNDVKFNIVHSGVGSINVSDINLAISTDSIVIGFNIRPEQNAESLAKQEGVDIRIYRIIFELVDDIKKALEGLLAPKYKEVIIGKVQVKKVFNISKIGTVAGCVVLEGKIQRNSSVRLIRDNSIVADTKIASLRVVKNDVKEVEKGHECGVLLENYNDIKIGDIIEVYTKEKIEQKIVEHKY